ncbi:MAG: phosphatase PAP2 family protein [Sphingomonadaceae bacterium]
MAPPLPPLHRWLGELPVVLIAGALFGLCTVLLARHGVWPELGPILGNLRLYLLSILVIGCVDAGRALMREKPAAPAAFLLARYISPAARLHAASGAIMLALCVVLMPFFSKMKAAIPLFNPYTWDAAFIAWDRALFFGYDAWEVLQPVLGYPVITAFLAFLYQVWFLLLYPGVLWFAYAAMDETVRRRFFLSYVLSWTVVGGAMATWLASVGPCFIGPLLGDRTFDAQMAYLNAANEQVPVMTLKVQGMLLEWFHADANGLGSGITAMPSMHVAIAFLYWLAMRHAAPRAARWFGLFFAVTWVSSVHLAYHYAVDGLVSVIVVAAIWRVSAAIFSAWDSFLARQATLRTNTVPAE